MDISDITQHGWYSFPDHCRPRIYVPIWIEDLSVKDLSNKDELDLSGVKVTSTIIIIISLELGTCFFT